MRNYNRKCKKVDGIPYICYSFGSTQGPELPKLALGVSKIAAPALTVRVKHCPPTLYHTPDTPINAPKQSSNLVGFWQTCCATSTAGERKTRDVLGFSFRECREIWPVGAFEPAFLRPLRKQPVFQETTMSHHGNTRIGTFSIFRSCQPQ